MLLQVAH